MNETELPGRIRESAGAVVSDTLFIFGGVCQYVKQNTVFEIAVPLGGARSPRSARRIGVEHIAPSVEDLGNGSYDITYEILEVSKCFPFSCFIRNFP